MPTVDEGRPPVVALLGDLVGSRTAPDRRALHRVVVAALDAAQRRRPALGALAVTAGDEFQGVYATMGAALEAAHAIRLDLSGTADVRFGLGCGAVAALEDGSSLQDGPGWWAARAAITDIEDAARRPGWSALRIGLAAADPATLDPVLRAAVRAVDLALHPLDASSRRILLGLVGGRRQSEIAGALGLTPQAVSQRVLRHQLGVLAETLRLLWEAP